MELVDLISPERLRTYSGFTSDQKRSIALHNQTMQLGSSLMSVIALFELALRNSINHQLILDFGDEDWLKPDHRTLPLKQFEKRAISKAHSLAQKAAYSKLSYREKRWLDAFAYPGGKPNNTTHEKEVRDRRALFVVSHGQIIAQTTLVFWKRLFSKDYEADLWRPSLKKVFPNKKLKRHEVSAALEKVYAVRNRVAHHEPVYGKRLEDAMKALRFLRNSLGAGSFDDDTAFKRFSEVLFLRLQMDHASFQETWDTLT